MEQARISKKVGCAYRCQADWGKFKYTNYTAVKYSNTHFVFENPTKDVTYFPIQKDKLFHDRKNNRIRISCLGIEEPFEIPPGFTDIRFVHIYHNYILIDYTEAHDWIEYKQVLVNAAIEVLSFMEEREDEITDEMKALVVYKFKYNKRIVQEMITDNRKRIPKSS